MDLSQVLAGVKLLGKLSPAMAERSVGGLAYDSRRVGKDFLFFAFPGAHVDGRTFAAQAIARGALAVVSELPRPADFSGEWIQVEHGRRALAVVALNFFHHPDQRVEFTGITGTNGKTTTSYVLDAILREAGFVTGRIGTIDYRLADEVLPAANTTPESLDVIALADELARRGGRHLIMEVSSHALALGRVFGIKFHTAVFTNLTRDHLDFHHTMEEYAAAKRLLFAPEGAPAPEFAVLNAEDQASHGFATGASKELWYGDGGAIRAEKVRSDFSGLHFDLAFEGARQKIESPMNGRINVMNILAAAGAGLSYGIDLETIARGVANCRAVPGRFEKVDEGQPFLVVVDYAHTDDALRNVIQVARGLTKGRVITLFGCGGDRDRSKRPLMGMAAAELSDFVVLTSDNPRSEDPLDIMNDAMVGIRRFDTPHVAEPDREKAIRVALGEARPGDVVLLAGKGHETYQVLRERTIHFDDREVARGILKDSGFRIQDSE